MYNGFPLTNGIPLTLNTHNVYLEYLVEGGIFGLVFVFWFCFHIIKQIAYNKKTSNMIVFTFNSGLLSFWVSFLFVNLLNSYFWTSGTLVVFIFLYFLWNTNISEKKFKLSSSKKFFDWNINFR